MTRPVVLIGLALAAMSLAPVVGLVWLVSTPRGSALAARWAIRWALQPSDLIIRTVEGSLRRELVFRGARLANPRHLPPGTVIQLQRLTVALQPWALDRSSVSLFNGRLRLPASAPILFYGGYEEGRLDMTVYTRVVSLRHFLHLFSDAPAMASLDGTVRDFNAAVTGSWRTPRVSGEFQLEELTRGTFALKGCPATFDLALQSLPAPGRPPALHGTVRCEGGTVTVKRTTVQLAFGALHFSGDPKFPSLHANASTTIDDTAIRLVLQGSLRHPELRVTSTPPRDPARLLLMLATGQGWQKTEEALRRGEVSLGAAKEFLDYLVFGGGGPRTGFAGVDVKVKYEEDVRGIGATIRLFDQLGIGYGLEQSQPAPGMEQTLTHRVQAEQQLGHATSIELEAERTVSPSLNQQDDVWLKLKQKF